MKRVPFLLDDYDVHKPRGKYALGLFCLEVVVIEDEHYMRLALELAKLGYSQTAPNPMVGAVIVRDHEIVGQGAHLKAGEAHAEVHALRMAGDKAKGATLYVTLEPCSHHGRTPPCADAVIRAGIKRVVIAIEDKNPLVSGDGIERLRGAGIEVTTGVLAKEAYLLNEVFFTWASLGRPFVLWKCASTLDGYVATETGDSKWVTSEESRRTVQELRRTLPAIAVGIGTVLEDNPRLTVRGEGDKQPLRVIFDSALRFPTDRAMLREPGRTLIYTVKTEAEIESSPVVTEYQTRKQGVSDNGDDGRNRLEVVSLPSDHEGRISLQAALEDLAKRGVTGMLLEGGATLVREFVRHRFIDKIAYYIAPKLLGGGVPSLTGIGPEWMKDAIPLKDVSWTPVGDDIRLDAYLDWG